jgi:hypothetical protein
MTPLEFLVQLQAEAENGFHRKLQAWVDDNSSVARVLRDADARSRELGFTGDGA